MNIQTHAHKLIGRNLKKHEAQALIEDIYKGNPATLDELAALYKYFMPAIPKNCDPVAWVAKARSKEQVRHDITQSYCDGENLVATDGHRLHFIKCGKPVGYYDHNGQPIDMDGTFPDWQRVIPRHDNRMDFTTEGAEITENMCYVINGALFQKQYVDDALNGETTATIYYGYELEPIILAMAHGHAVIMPKRK